MKPLAEIDPAFFIRACLTDESGNPVELAPVHEELQQFLTKHSRALVELPRDHGKSFQVCGRILWELGRNPALRVKIVCATDSIAAERSHFLRCAIAENVRLRLIFPDLRPAEPWTADAFTVERPANVIGPSVAAFGVGAGSTGTRADLLVCDDVVDVRAIRSRAERDRVSDYFTNNLMNLLEPDGRFWGLCTPWHADDLNARLKKNGAYELFRAPVGPEFEPVWPEKWPAERLRERMAEIGSASFARGYRLVPIADDETPIRAKWVRFWSEPAECDTILLSVDPAVSTSAKADRSALVLLGRTTTPAGAVEVRVLACAARRVAAPDLMALIDEFDREYNPALILFESNAAFLGLRAMFATQAPFGAKVKGVTQSADKNSRVAAFSVAVENGAFRLKGEAGAVDAGQGELFDEMTTFPFGEHDDLLDAAATGTAHLLDRREPRVWGL
jgi:phage terminase large subunit-like protein